MRQRNEWFGPDALTPLYRTYVVGLVVVSLGVPIVATALVEDAPWYVPAGLGALAVVSLAFLWWWAAAYTRSIGIRLTDDEVEFRGGVWWQTHSTVPYTRVTNVKIKQGPITRRFGVGTIAIQTAGEGGQSTAEVSIQGMADYEKLSEQLMGLVRAQEGDRAGDATDSTSATMAELLSEVRAIRETLDGP